MGRALAELYAPKITCMPPCEEVGRYLGSREVVWEAILVDKRYLGCLVFIRYFIRVGHLIPWDRTRHGQTGMDNRASIGR